MYRPTGTELCGCRYEEFIGASSELRNRRLLGFGRVQAEPIPRLPQQPSACHLTLGIAPASAYLIGFTNSHRRLHHIRLARQFLQSDSHEISKPVTSSNVVPMFTELSSSAIFAARSDANISVKVSDSATVQVSLKNTGERPLCIGPQLPSSWIDLSISDQAGSLVLRSLKPRSDDTFKVASLRAVSNASCIDPHKTAVLSFQGRE